MPGPHLKDCMWKKTAVHVSLNTLPPLSNSVEEVQYIAAHILLFNMEMEAFQRYRWRNVAQYRENSTGKPVRGSKRLEIQMEIHDSKGQQP